MSVLNKALKGAYVIVGTFIEDYKEFHKDDQYVLSGIYTTRENAQVDADRLEQQKPYVRYDVRKLIIE